MKINSIIFNRRNTNISSWIKRIIPLNDFIAGYNLAKPRNILIFPFPKLLKQPLCFFDHRQSISKLFKLLVKFCTHLLAHPHRARFDFVI